MNKVINLLNFLTAPTAVDEEQRQQEFILNVILLGAIVLGVFATAANWVSPGVSEELITFLIPFLVLVVFLSLFVLSKMGYARWSAKILLLAFFLPTAYTLVIGGEDNPTILLAFSLTIVMASVIASTRLALVYTLTTLVLMVASISAQAFSFYTPDFSWRLETPDYSDFAIHSLILLVILTTAWLYNTQIKRSLKKAQDSEAALKKERDNLELRVEERTRELKQMQLEKMSEMVRFAEFGKLSSGVFHDLTNHLAALSFNVQELNNVDGGTPEGTEAKLQRAAENSQKVMGFVRAIRKQIQQQEMREYFSLVEELRQVLQVLRYRAEQGGVELFFDEAEEIGYWGNPLKFHQVMSNLLANAIDSYAGVEAKEKRVHIFLEQVGEGSSITVQDWGRGIAPEILPKIFEPFFTTKSVNEGVGLGLYITKEIIEQDFSGTLQVESVIGEGSRFTVRLPSSAADNGEMIAGAEKLAAVSLGDRYV